MILVRVNAPEYGDDVCVLTRAFYPNVKVSVNVEEGETVERTIEVNVENGRVSTAIDGKLLHEVCYQNEERKTIFDALKSCVYQGLSAYTQKELPWGSLTGVRPTKIVTTMLDGGESDEKIVTYLKDKYYVSDGKIDLSLNVAKREKHLLDMLDYKNGYSLYVGIPFCPTTCLYCSFTSYPIGVWKKETDRYVEALLKELDYVATAMADKKPDTIYFGGGTPTTLEPEQLDRILSKLEECFDLSHVKELTVEAGRPDSVTQAKFEVLKKHQVSRISINPQTMNQKTLDLIGRRHTVEQVKEAFALARACGFDNINMDLIVGLPGETMEDVRHTMEEIRKLNPENLTVHSLAIKRAAALNFWKDKYMDSILNTDEIIQMTAQYAKEMNLNPYYMYRQKNMAGNFENVGYAKEGMEGLYNILIMEEVQTIIACGAGASTKIVYPDENRIERVENVKDVQNYIHRIDEMIERKRKFL